MEFEEILTVHAQMENMIELNNNDRDSVIMISFKFRVTGKYFNGEILDVGVDTQIIGKYGDRQTLSAKYILENEGYTG